MIHFIFTRNPWKRYLIVIFIITLAWCAAIILSKDLGTAAPYLAFSPAVMIAALYGGLSTGVTAAILSAVLMVVTLPSFQPSPMISVTGIGIFIFLLVGIIISCVCEHFHQEVNHLKKVMQKLSATGNKARIIKRKRMRLVDMDHDLRTPLNVIMGYCQLMQRDPHATAEQHEHLSAINTNGRQLLKLIDKAMAIAKTDQEKSLGFTADIADMDTDNPIAPNKKHDDLRVIGMAPGQKTFRVLVADDSDTNRFLLATLLTSVGFEVREATDGRECVDLHQQWRPHLIWMDIKMPVMDGIEATRRIKTTDRGRQTSVIALTGHGANDKVKAMMAAGCTDFIRKPFDAHDIFAIMKKELGLTYRYQKRATEKGPAVSNAGRIPDQLFQLPLELRSRLRDAVLKLNVQGVSELIGEIEAANPALGHRLKELADQLDYNHLFELLNTSPHDQKREI